MKLIPYDHFIVHSGLQPEEVRRRLAMQTSPDQISAIGTVFRNTSCIFQGTVQADQFQIMRIITYRNSFAPVLRGTVRQVENGTEIDVRMGMLMAVKLFMTVWFLACFFFAMAWLCLGGNSTDLTIPCVMIVFGYCIVEGGFWYEAKESRESLERVIFGDMPCTM